MNARGQALELLDQWGESRRFADELLDEGLNKSELRGADRALATELFYGCLRQRLVLERLTAELAARPPRPALARVVQLGLYQLFFLDRVPAHAAVNETVAAAKERVSPAEVGFVNALLRRADAQRPELRARIESWRATEPWTYYSHPHWLWDRWAARWGAEQAHALAAWNNQPAPVYVRVNTLRNNQATTDGTDAHGSDSALSPTPLHPLCRRVGNPGTLFRSVAWANGEYYAQDPSTLVAVDLLDPQPGEAVLDTCAAPGGKTTYIAQRMENRGRVLAADASAPRLGLVAENCQRLGVTIVATLACEGTRLERCLRGSRFDRVLVDAPCSNTGVLRRRVDLRWRLEAAEIPRLAVHQLKLLAAAAGFVRPGGILVYSTCSLETEENEAVAVAFSAGEPTFAAAETRLVFPPRDGMDGAFVVKFRKK